MDVERFWLINVIRPKQAQIFVLPSGPARNAFKSELDGAVLEKLVAQATFQTPMRRRRLVQLGSVFIDDAKFHRSMSRLEKNFFRLFRAVVDVFEVQTAVAGHEKIAR